MAEQGLEHRSFNTNSPIPTLSKGQKFFKVFPFPQTPVWKVLSSRLQTLIEKELQSAHMTFQTMADYILSLCCILAQTHAYSLNKSFYARHQWTADERDN